MKKYVSGTEHGNSIFDEAQIFQIRHYKRLGYRTSAIASKYQCSIGTINRIVGGRRYATTQKNTPVSQAGAR